MSDDPEDLPGPDTIEVDDAPLGVQDDAPDPEDAPSPGLPESEPPNSG